MRSIISAPAASAAFGLLTVLASGVPPVTSDASAQSVADPALRVEPVITGLLTPTTMAFVGDDDFLYLEKMTGRVRRVTAGVLNPAAVLDVAVNFGGEQGLLGIAVNTEDPPRVFLYFSEADDPTGLGIDGGPLLAHRVYSYTWNAAANVLESPVLILDLPVNPLHACHVGGILALGPPTGFGPGDGAPLHVVIGDLGLSIAAPAQLTNAPTGTPPDDKAVIFRVQQDGSPAPGNPFAPYCDTTITTTCSDDTDCPGGESCVTEVEAYFAYGIRNSFGMALDPATGDLWETANGPVTYDEVNRVEPGFNNGWHPLMGPDSRDPQSTVDLWNMPGAGPTYSDPEFSWFLPVAVTAIVFPVGSALGASYDDVALVGDAKIGQVYRFPLNAGRDGFDLSQFPDLTDLVADGSDGFERDLPLLASGFGAVTDLKVGPDGNVYVVDYGFGAIHRLVPACPPAPGVRREPVVREKSRVVLRDDADSSRDRLAWKWKKGAATTKAELGNPTTSDGFSLCVYDGSGLRSSSSVAAGGLCNGKPCWKEKAGGYRYRDRTSASDGIELIKLKAGIAGKASIVIRGRGAGLDLPAPASLTSPVAVQLHKRAGGVCWGAQFSFPPALENTADRFKNRSD